MTEGLPKFRMATNKFLCVHLLQHDSYTGSINSLMLILQIRHWNTVYNVFYVSSIKEVLWGQIRISVRPCWRSTSNFLWHCEHHFNYSYDKNNDQMLPTSYIKLCVCVPMPTHCTITCFGFHARWIDGVKCGLFLNHAPLGQTTLRVG